MENMSTTPVLQTPRPRQTRRELLAPIGAGFALAALGWLAARWQPLFSPALLAMLGGVLARNLFTLPGYWEPGLEWLSRTALRAGIVLLGFKVVLGDILALGGGAILLAVAIVVLGLVGSYGICRWLGMGHAQSLLIASGFSICGAAAVAGAGSVVHAKDEDVSLAVGLVVLFGTLMIAVVPAVGALLGFDAHAVALLAGASTHEVAQVVVIGGFFGGTALATAVIMKLARVVLMAPLMLTLNLLQRRHQRQPVGGKRPPLVPLFVLGFLAAMLLASLLPIPAAVGGALGMAQTLLLAAAMFGLGCKVRLATWRALGAKPFLAGTLATALVTLISVIGVMLIGR